MAISNYSTLKSAIKDWAYDADELTDAEIDNLIQLAESEMQDRTRVREMVTRGETITLDANGEGAMPAAYLATKRVVHEGARKVSLKQRTEEELDDEYSYNDSAAEPRIYAITGETIIVRPIPGASIKMDYYARWPGITSTNTTGTMLSAHPDLYIWACRKQLAVFEDDKEDLTKYDRLLKEAVDMKNDNSAVEEYGRTAVRRKGPHP